ncbi:glycosyltransferase family A protein [Aminobacter sp. AP02]|uniref:glycosyltransferase family 2 protein n=1 Tax=Aminobacter sp. AP02 TaxID=2135737 RepID=UPI000D78E9EB|nr:glycosyltransferase family A protein [Aminobacter sp. AP02]PWK76877.1 glycosyl transferase family 2 [Aminobacter sp. AP02]
MQRTRPKPDGNASVTVVIPCYNYARYLPQALQSALSQAGVITNVVIVDDASSDDSLAVARSLATSDARIAVLAHERNMGPVQTFNDGLAQAQGEFLVRLDADDLLTPGSLARSVAVMRQNANVGLVYGHPLHFSGEALPVPRLTATHSTIRPGHQWLADRCRFGFNVITSPEVMMRKSVVDRVGGQQPLAHTHDMEMWLRVAAFSDVAYIHGADQAWHREHSASLSARKVDVYRDLVERRAAFEVLFAGIAGKIPQAADLRFSAMMAIATDAIELASRQYDHPRADIEMVEKYCEVARATVPAVEDVPGWNGLKKRMAMGSRIASRHPLFFFERAVRGLRGAVRRRRWHRTGEI